MEESYNQNIQTSFHMIIDSLALLKLQISDLQQKIRTIEKDIKKEFKQTLKLTNIKLQNKPNKKPSGFAKPTQITKELCEFMNKPIGTEIARTEVTKSLVAYIQENKLQEQGKTSNIIPDSKLQHLLGISNEQIPDLTFFTIQKYMNKHFVSSKQKSLDKTIDNELV
jgi:chromatin remodeling complex protein RSC6